MQKSRVGGQARESKEGETETSGAALSLEERTRLKLWDGEGRGAGRGHIKERVDYWLTQRRDRGGGGGGGHRRRGEELRDDREDRERMVAEIWNTLAEEDFHRAAHGPGCVSRLKRDSAENFRLRGIKLQSSRPHQADKVSGKGLGLGRVESNRSYPA